MESKGFSTRVGENFNDSGLIFCSPIVIVCATNVRKHHIWKFCKPSPVKQRSENNSEASSMSYRNENKGTGIRVFAESIY